MVRNEDVDVRPFGICLVLEGEGKKVREIDR